MESYSAGLCMCVYACGYVVYLFLFSLQENAHILVAGSASTKMPSDVRKALARVCESSGKMSASDAQEFLLRMEKRRKFCVEAWS